MEEFTVTGSHHVRDYLRHRPQVVIAISAPASWQAEMPPVLRRVAIRSSVVQARIRLTPLHESELFSFAAKDKLGSTIVALDHIVDPQNLGAIARSAAFFGVRAIIVPRRRQVTMTPAVVNAAQGGFAFLDLFLVTNLSRTLGKLKECGFWLIGADVRGDCLTRYDFARKVLLFGSEGKGLSTVVRKKCDCLARIVAVQPAPQSLNVSAAAAIFLYQSKIS